MYKRQPRTVEPRFPWRLGDRSRSARRAPAGRRPVAVDLAQSFGPRFGFAAQPGDPSRHARSQEEQWPHRARRWPDARLHRRAAAVRGRGEQGRDAAVGRGAGFAQARLDRELRVPALELLAEGQARSVADESQGVEEPLVGVVLVAGRDAGLRVPVLDDELHAESARAHGGRAVRFLAAPGRGRQVPPEGGHPPPQGRPMGVHGGALRSPHLDLPAGFGHPSRTRRVVHRH